MTAGGGSDHMQKIGSFRSINPYNPFLGMYVAISRRARGYDGQLHPEEALTREQAIRFYTINNARLMFLEDRIGSLEAGKQADFVVDRPRPALMPRRRDQGYPRAGDVTSMARSSSATTSQDRR